MWRVPRRFERSFAHGTFAGSTALGSYRRRPDGIFQTALASYVFFSPQNATTPAKAAAAFAALLLPYSIAGPFVGVFLDRWRRQRVLVIANTVKVALVLVVAGLVLANSDGVAFFVTAVVGTRRQPVLPLGAIGRLAARRRAARPDCRERALDNVRVGDDDRRRPRSAQASGWVPVRVRPLSRQSSCCRRSSTAPRLPLPRRWVPTY